MLEEGIGVGHVLVCFMALSTKLGQRPSSVFHVCSRLIVGRSVRQKRLKMLDRLARILTPKKNEGQPVVSTRGRRILLEHVAIRLRSLLNHTDPCVADRDLLQYGDVPGRLLQGQPERSERFVKLADRQQIESLVIIVDRPDIIGAQDLLPKSHTMVGSFSGRVTPPPASVTTPSVGSER